MRRMILALTVVVVPTAVMALPAGGALVGTELTGSAVQKIAVLDQDLGGNVILAKGDKSGSGPGAGGHKGQKKGGNHGKQKKEKEK